VEGRPREWLAAREADLLPVGYFHVVFTVPAEIAVAQRPSAAARSAVDRNVWPAPSASGFSVSGLICLHKRIRPSGEPLAKMESRAF